MRKAAFVGIVLLAAAIYWYADRIVMGIVGVAAAEVMPTVGTVASAVIGVKSFMG